jgi:hypothetical protein
VAGLLAEPAGSEETFALTQACRGNPSVATAFAKCAPTLLRLNDSFDVMFCAFWRGLTHAPRVLPTPSEEVALRLRTLRTWSGGLVDHSRSQALAATTRYLQLALAAKDSVHLTRALGLNAALGGEEQLLCPGVRS